MGEFSPDQVTVYNRTASGNTAPLRTLQARATGLSPADLALDPTHDELFVANYSQNSVTVYNRTASGNTAPLRTLQGGATGLSGPSAVALDSTPSLSLLASVNQPTFAVGQTGSIAAGVTNPGLTGAADFFLGVFVPGGSIAFFMSAGLALGSAVDFFRHPFASGVPLAAPFSETKPNFFSYQGRGAEPHGNYLFGIYVFKTGWAADGVLSDDEILGVAEVPFSFP